MKNILLSLGYSVFDPFLKTKAAKEFRQVKVTQKQGCQFFLGTTYRNWGKYVH
jgi:hypothetical protein